MMVVGNCLPVDMHYLVDHVEPQILTSHMCTQIRRLPKLSQWTMSRKAPLDRLLEMEMRSDEASWLKYTAYEEEIKQNLSEQIFAQLFDESFRTVLSLIPRHQLSSSRPCEGPNRSPSPLPKELVCSKRTRNSSSISEIVYVS